MNFSNLFSSSPHRRSGINTGDRELQFRRIHDRPLNYPSKIPFLGETDPEWIYKWVPVSQDSERGYFTQATPAMMGEKGYVFVKAIEFPHLSFLSTSTREALNTIDRELGIKRERSTDSDQKYIYHRNEVLMKVPRELFEENRKRDRNYATQVAYLTTDQGFNDAHAGEEKVMSTKVAIAPSI